MGWSNQIPNPFVIGGGGVSGRIEVYDAAGILLATLDELGLIFYDSSGNDVSVQDQFGLSVYDPTNTAAVGVFPGYFFMHPDEGASPYAGTYGDALFYTTQFGAPDYTPYTYLDCPAYDVGDYASLYIVAEDVVSGDPPHFDFRGFTGAGISGGWFRLLWGMDFRMQDTTSSAVVSVGRGFRGGTSSTSSTAAIGAETVVLTITNFVFRDGRAYRIKHYGGLVTSADGVYADLRLRRTNVAGATITEFYRYRGQGASVLNMEGERIVQNPIGGGDITTTVVLTMQVSGAGTVTHWAFSGLPRVLWIEDIGDAADFSFATII